MLAVALLSRSYASIETEERVIAKSFKIILRRPARSSDMIRINFVLQKTVRFRGSYDKRLRQGSKKLLIRDADCVLGSGCRSLNSLFVISLPLRVLRNAFAILRTAWNTILIMLKSWFDAIISIPNRFISPFLCLCGH